MEEKWAPVKGYEGYYEVSNLGRIKSLKRFGVLKDRLLKPGVMSKGYLTVRLFIDGNATCLLLHRLIAIAFLPNPDNKLEVNHIDSNIRNCTLSNLEWCTRSENIKHSYSFGKNTQTGIRNSKCKLSEDDVHSIRKSNKLNVEEARLHKVSAATISSIRRRKTWTHI